MITAVRLLFLKLALLSFVATAMACELQHAAGSESFAIEFQSADSRPTRQAGETVAWRWVLSKIGDEASAAGCEGRFVAVFAFDRDVRFKDGGFVAVPGGSPGLYGIDAFAQQDRAFFEFATVEDAAPVSLAVTFWVLGRNTVTSQLFFVWRSEDGSKAFNVALTSGTEAASVDVVAGKAVFGAENVFDTTVQMRTVNAENRGWQLRDFGSFFRVVSHDGRLILEAPGSDANFSPTGAFVAATFGQGFDVYDARSGTLVYRLRLDVGGVRDFNVTAVGWAERDAFLVFSLGSIGALLIKPTIMDDVEWKLDNGTGDLRARQQEPGHAADMVIKLSHNQFSTSYFRATLTGASDQELAFIDESYDVEDNWTGLLEPVAVGQTGPWGRVNWPLGPDFVLSHDFASQPREDNPYDAVTSAELARLRDVPPPNSAHFYYSHRQGGPGYIRYGAIFNVPAPRPWVTEVPAAIREFLSRDRLFLADYRIVEKVYSLNPGEIDALDQAANLPHFPMLADDGSVTGMPMHNTTPEEVDGYLKYLMLNEEEIYRQHYQPDVAEGPVDRDFTDESLIVFPNNIDQDYKFLSTFSLINRIGTTSILDTIIYIEGDEFESVINLSAEEKQALASAPRTEFDCVGSDGTLMRVLPWSVRDVWRAQLADSVLWIFQSSCTGGLRGDWQLGQITLMRVYPDGSLEVETLGVDRCGEVACNSLSAEIASLRVGMAGDNVLVLQGHNNSFLTYDLTTKAATPVIRRSEEGGGSVAVPTIDARYILLLQQSGNFQVIDIASTETVLHGFHVDGEVVVFNQDGRFDSTEDGSSFVRVKFPGIRNLQSLRQFRRQLHEPGLVGKLLEDARIVGPRLVDIPPPPELAVIRDAVDPTAVRIEAPPYAETSEVVLVSNGWVIDRLPVPETGLDLPRQYGRHITEALRISAAGAESLVVAVGPPAEVAGKLYVVAKGVSDYADGRIPDLRYANSDATRFCESVRRNVSSYASIPGEETECALPAGDDLVARLRATAARMTADDTLFLFYSGHGYRDDLGEFYLLTGNTSLDDLRSTAIDWSRLSEALGAIPGRVFLFLDACHAGQAGRLLTNDDLVAGMQVSSAGAVYVIAASKGRQRSWEMSSLKSGAFTAVMTHLFAKPSDQEGVLVDDFFRRLRGQVGKITGDRQTPWLTKSLPLAAVPLY